MSCLTRAAKQAPLERIRTFACRIPTEMPESDGTLAWDSTTIVFSELEACGITGIGYTYAGTAAAEMIRDSMPRLLLGEDAWNIPGLWQKMVSANRNAGRPGTGAMAVSAMDAALWDLKAKLLDVSLAVLLGEARRRVPVYGSGGFTSYSLAGLEEDMQKWTAQGITRVKMKVGRDPASDPERVCAARRAVGTGAELYVDANGAYSRKQALRMAEHFSAQGVSWFEEPVSSNDLEGLQLLCSRVPAPVEIAAGEYAYTAADFRRLIEAKAVDVMQADASRCCGITGFLKAAALCEAYELPLSSHTAPTLHLPVCLAAPGLRHLEYFYDHVRIERMLFDGFPEPVDGYLSADPGRPGFGVELKRADAEPFLVFGSIR